MRQFAIRLAMICTTLTVIGCSGGGSGKTAVVSGKVTVAGKDALPGGDIIFTPVADPGKTLKGAIAADGTYKLPGVPYGELKVAVENSHLKSLPPTAGGTAAMGEGGQVKYVKIDPKYTKADTSGLKTTVTGATHTYNVDLP